jgi:hypothetical protein
MKTYVAVGDGSTSYSLLQECWRMVLDSLYGSIYGYAPLKEIADRQGMLVRRVTQLQDRRRTLCLRDGMCGVCMSSDGCMAVFNHGVWCEDGREEKQHPSDTEGGASRWRCQVRQKARDLFFSMTSRESAILKCSVVVQRCSCFVN